VSEFDLPWYSALGLRALQAGSRDGVAHWRTCHWLDKSCRLRRSLVAEELDHVHRVSSGGEADSCGWVVEISPARRGNCRIHNRVPANRCAKAEASQIWIGRRGK